MTLVITCNSLNSCRTFVGTSESFLRLIRPTGTATARGVAPILRTMSELFQGFCTLARNRCRTMISSVRTFSLSVLSGSPIIDSRSVRTLRKTVRILLTVKLNNLRRCRRKLARTVTTSTALRKRRKLSDSQTLTSFLRNDFRHHLKRASLTLRGCHRTDDLSGAFCVRTNVTHVCHSEGVPSLTVNCCGRTVGRIRAMEAGISSVSTTLRRTILRSVTSFSNLHTGSVCQRLTRLLLTRNHVPRTRRILSLLGIRRLRRFAHTA